MQNLGLKLNPLSKFKIYSVAKKLILQKMDHNQVTPMRAMELIDYFKNILPSAGTAE